MKWNVKSVIHTQNDTKESVWIYVSLYRYLYLQIDVSLSSSWKSSVHQGLNYSVTEQPDSFLHTLSNSPHSQFACSYCPVTSLPGFQNQSVSEPSSLNVLLRCYSNCQTVVYISPPSRLRLVLTVWVISKSLHQSSIIQHQHWHGGTVQNHQVLHLGHCSVLNLFL